MKKKLFANKSFLLGFSLICFTLTLMLVSLFWTPYDPLAIDAGGKFAAPTGSHWLGTDNFGRDVLSRVMVGSQTTFLVGFISVSISSLFGITLGLISAYFGGFFDQVVMRIMDALISLPTLLVALMIVAVFGSGIVNTMLAIGVVSVPSYTRLVRGNVLSIKEKNYILWAKGMGLKTTKIMLVYILPNIIAPITVMLSLGFAGAVLTESGLSFLGLGVQPPAPSWGRMLNELYKYIARAPWVVAAPAAAIIVTILGCNLLGDGIRDVFDIKNRE